MTQETKDELLRITNESLSNFEAVQTNNKNKMFLRSASTSIMYVFNQSYKKINEHIDEEINDKIKNFISDTESKRKVLWNDNPTAGDYYNFLENLEAGLNGLSSSIALSYCSAQ